MSTGGIRFRNSPYLAGFVWVHDGMVMKKPLVPYRLCRFVQGEFLNIALLQIGIYYTLMRHRKGRVLCESPF